jgi:hypothetical protein
MVDESKPIKDAVKKPATTAAPETPGAPPKAAAPAEEAKIQLGDQMRIPVGETWVRSTTDNNMVKDKTTKKY